MIITKNPFKKLSLPFTFKHKIMVKQVTINLVSVKFLLTNMKKMTFTGLALNSRKRPKNSKRNQEQRSIWG